LYSITTIAIFVWDGDGEFPSRHTKIAVANDMQASSGMGISSKE